MLDTPRVELARRNRHDHVPEVLFLCPDRSAWGPPSGSVSIVSGHVQSALVGRVREAARSGDAASLGRVLDSHLRQTQRHGLGTAAQPATTGSMSPIVRVSYRGTQIAEATLPREQLAAVSVLLPFAGGALDPQAFAAATYVAPGARGPEVATVVVVRQPRLSAFERRAVERLPREMGRMPVACQLDAGTPVARLVELRAQLVLAGRL